MVEKSEGTDGKTENEFKKVLEAKSIRDAFEILHLLKTLIKSEIELRRRCDIDSYY